ncbi:MAG: rhodanese-like domain-containing protein [Acidimicrobiales bacterium]
MERDQIDVGELAELLDSGVALLDVRQPDEHDEVNIPAAVLIPLDQLPDRLDDVPGTDEVYVICRSGGRSASACEFLTSSGRSAVNVTGGMLAWVDAGLPVAGSSAEAPEA